MAHVVLTIKIMPDSVDRDLENIKQACAQKVKEFGTEVGKTEIEPVAFGLCALKVFIILDEKDGSPDALEEELRNVEGVQSVEIIDVRRTIG